MLLAAQRMVDEAFLAVRARASPLISAQVAASARLDVTLKQYPRVQSDEGFSLSSAFGGERGSEGSWY